MDGLSMKDLGVTIRKIRKDRGMSQEELASKLGVTKSTISKYELGQREPSFLQVIFIAAELSVDPMVLIPKAMHDAFREGRRSFIYTQRYRNSKTKTEADNAEKDAIRLFRYFDELGEVGQKRAVACARALAGYDPFVDEEPPHAIDLAITALCKLNADGQAKAVERVEELKEIPKYQKLNSLEYLEDK